MSGISTHQGGLGRRRIPSGSCCSVRYVVSFDVVGIVEFADYDCVIIGIEMFALSYPCHFRPLDRLYAKLFPPRLFFWSKGSGQYKFR